LETFMFKLRNLGLLLVSLLAALAISGAAALIALDFVGVDGLARAWSAITGVSSTLVPPAQTARRSRIT
jgi:hypothetical protein